MITENSGLGVNYTDSWYGLNKINTGNKNQHLQPFLNSKVILTDNQLSKYSNTTNVNIGIKNNLTGKYLLLNQINKLKRITASSHSKHVIYYYNKLKSGISLRYLDKYADKLLLHYFSGEIKDTFVSKGVYKHTSSDLVILIYIYRPDLVKDSNNKSVNPMNRHNNSMTRLQGLIDNKNLGLLSKILESIYKKPVTLRVINLQYPHLNVDIFAQYIGKYTKKNNFLSFYNKIFSKFRIYQVNKLNFLANESLLGCADNVSTIRVSSAHLTKIKLLELKEREEKRDSFLSLIPYKFISGLKVELKGRFTRRRSAARSRALLRKKGSFKNLYSSMAGFKVHTKTGYLNANLQHGNFLSKSKNGRYNYKFTIASH